MSPFFRGPRQITASFWLPRRNPIDITARSPANTGDQPALLWCTSCPTNPSMVGTLGPQISTSRSPTSCFWESRSANWVATVLLPTPPLPERTSILCLTDRSLSAMAAMAGLTCWGAPEAQSDWLGHPEHEDYFPASLEAGPGQCSLAFSGTSLSISEIIILMLKWWIQCTLAWAMIKTQRIPELNFKHHI